MWDGNDRVAYVMAMTEFLEDENLQELHEYVTHEDTGAAPAGKAPWRQGQFKLFMSHLAVYESFVGEVDDVLTRYGVCSFVAHNSIEPSREWEDVIEAALRTCDAMAVFLHKGFKESNWCDQEVGFALARRVPVLPLGIDLNPHGFMGKLQAARCANDPAANIANKIMRWLVRTPSAQAALTGGIVTAFERSRSFNETRSLYNLLTHLPSFTPEQLRRREAAASDNYQVNAANEDGPQRRPIPQLIRALVAEKGGSPPGAADDIPF